MDDRSVRAAQARHGSPYLNTGQAAHYLGLSQRSMERMRTLGVGPAYRKHGNVVRYHIDDLDRWSAEHELRSTSQDTSLARWRAQA